jgi:ABC-2 type transport system ATP-binding protein
MSDRPLFSDDGPHTSPPPDRGKEVIQVRSLYKNYGQLAAVKGINFDVKRGEIFGLIGPDGAGKTTTFHILSGVMKASAGKVTLLGQSPQAARLLVGYLTQKFSLYPDLSVEENLRYAAGLRQVPPHLYDSRRAQYLRLVDLEPFSDRLAGQLSGGMKQKLALCCALISQPEILLLDEPTTGVDPVSRREFWDILAAVANLGMTVVVATPYLDEAERCHRIALVYEGQIQQMGTLSELRENLGLERLEIRSDHLDKMTQSLLRQPPPSLVDIQVFGDRLDVLVTDVVQGKADIYQICQRQQLEIKTIHEAELTLENIFVTCLRQRGQDPPFRSFPYTQARHAHHQMKVAIGAYAIWKVFEQFSAVKGIDLEIRYGEIYGLLGANGAGKTTMIKMLCGLVQPTRGEIALAGAKANLQSIALCQKLGYMSQKFTLYDDLSILQNLEFYCGVYKVPRSLRSSKIKWVLEICGLLGKEGMLTGQLPGGWKQRVAFGASVMHEPEILFLDEPTSGVDPLARRQFWKLINEFAKSGTAILVTTHYLEEAEQCHRMGFMVAGEIVAQGSPSQIKSAQPGQLVELVTDRIQQTSDLLKKHFSPWRVSIFGDRLHLVLVDPEPEILQVEEILRLVGIRISSRRSIPFSLEDAFINIVQRSH